MKIVKVIVTCEHGGNRVPVRYRRLFAFARSVLATHRGYDAGALQLFRRFAARVADASRRADVTRLLVDLNRSETNAELFSRYSAVLTRAQKQHILETWYRPYRSAVERQIRRWIAAGCVVVHLSVHSFTPKINGRLRKVDIGLLFDPARKDEARLCGLWRAHLKKAAPRKRVSFNRPYRGTDDGLTTYLRSKFPRDRYLGIELETNQRFVRRGGKGWIAMQRTLVDSFEQALLSYAKR